MTQPLVSVRNLTVDFSSSHGEPVSAVSNISFDVQRSGITALVGESGSGKSVTARTLLGLAGEGARVHADALTILGSDARGYGERQWRALRGREVGLVLQDALTSLDPLRPVGKEVSEVLEAHHWGTRTTRRERVVEALEEAGLPDAAMQARVRSGELSGGERQRSLIAQALALRPALLIADEATTALDATVQAQILDLFEFLRDQGHGILLISHDLAVVSRLADEVLVLNRGVVVEQGPTREVLSHPNSDYTRALIATIPEPSKKGRRLSGSALAVEQPITVAPSSATEVAIEVEGITKLYKRPGRAATAVVDDVSFRVQRGTTLGIVGESGSGKSTIAWIIAGLKRPETGTVRIFGEQWSALPKRERLRLRRSVQVVYQDPLSSFDPRHSVGAVLNDALTVTTNLDRAARQLRVHELLDQVGLAGDLETRRPLTLSGGQRQRLAIARALASAPEILVLDEPVSALDVSIQAQILDLLADLQQRLGLTYVFVSHDLSVVYHVSDTVVVVKNGVIVERGDAHSVLTNPSHPYTRQLIAAIQTMPAEVPS